MSVRYNLEGQRRAYSVWAPFYDAIYARFLRNAQRRLAASVSVGGPEILEVGVGTGLTLPFYDRRLRIIGVDLSPEMLGRAQEKVEALRLAHVRLLAAMDACRLGFPDAAFDAVALPFVITLVPDPEAALDECARVLRPGGSLVIATRFGNEAGAKAAFEKALAPAMKAIGLSTTFKLSRVDAWARRAGTMRITDVHDGFYFKVVRLAKAG